MFERKILARLWSAVIICIIGIILIIVGCTTNMQDSLCFSMGVALIAVEVLRIIKNIKLLKNKDALKNQKIAETDERNVSICHKARSLTFVISMLITAVIMIALAFMGKGNISEILGYYLCGQLIIYLVVYGIMIRR